MKLQQLRFFSEIVQQGLNVSLASEVLYTSQSGISKQMQLLEQELGVALFERNGRKLTALTEPGEVVLKLAREILQKSEDIKKAAADFTEQKKCIAIATTHTQARYVLPIIVEKFMSLHRDIMIHIHQGTPEQVAQLLLSGEVDIAIATEVLSDCESLTALPCYQWSRSVIVRQDHPLAQKTHLDLDDIVCYPIITYEQGFTGRKKQDAVFIRHHLQPNIVLTAVDADVIKTYVRLGLGIGIIADMAFSLTQDHDLVAHSVEHLFGMTQSYLALQQGRYMKPYLYPFIELFAPHLTPELIRSVMQAENLEARRHYFRAITVPRYTHDLRPNGLSAG
jgi:LysR family cys regulon transcriptional activator